jgi:hypothetical protein
MVAGAQRLDAPAKAASPCERLLKETSASLNQNLLSASLATTERATRFWSLKGGNP